MSNSKDEWAMEQLLRVVSQDLANLKRELKLVKKLEDCLSRYQKFLKKEKK